jgi:hypothetical protein
MSAPNLSISLQPVRNGKATYLPLGAPTSNDTPKGKIVLYPGQSKTWTAGLINFGAGRPQVTGQQRHLSYRADPLEHRGARELRRVFAAGYGDVASGFAQEHESRGSCFVAYHGGAFRFAESYVGSVVHWAYGTQIFPRRLLTVSTNRRTNT